MNLRVELAAKGLDAGPAEGGKYRRSESYRERKNDLTERLLDAAESVLGPFRDNIVPWFRVAEGSYDNYVGAALARQNQKK